MDSPWSALPEIPLVPPTADALDEATRNRLRTAGQTAQAAIGVLKQGGLNIVSAILADQGTFFEMNHYPEDDVYDPKSASQYYYHAHRGGEHGHFHTFVRRKAMPDSLRPAPGFKRSEPLPAFDAELDRFRIDGSYPHFAVNQWLSQCMALCRPQIEALLRHRDAVIQAWQAAHPGRDVLEDRELEMTGYLPFNMPRWIAELA